MLYFEESKLDVLIYAALVLLTLEKAIKGLRERGTDCHKGHEALLLKFILKHICFGLGKWFSSSGSNAKSERPEWAVSTCRVSTAGKRQGDLGSVLAQTDTICFFSRRVHSLSLKFRFLYIK